MRENYLFYNIYTTRPLIFLFFGGLILIPLNFERLILIPLNIDERRFKPAGFLNP